jgi:mRNA interferase RelE/StbE
MFEVVVRPAALRQLRRLRRVDAVAIVDALERYLRYEPDRPNRSRIKRLRGQQDATYRLRVGDYRVFYDVGEELVTVIAVLHKRETAAFYQEGNR